MQFCPRFAILSKYSFRQSMHLADFSDSFQKRSRGSVARTRADAEYHKAVWPLESFPRDFLTSRGSAALWRPLRPRRRFELDIGFVIFGHSRILRLFVVMLLSLHDNQ